MKKSPFAYFLVLMTILTCSMRIDAQLNISGNPPLPVAYGGTGTTTSTGTGSVVLSASPTFTGAPLFPSGGAATPGMGFSVSPGSGWWWSAAAGGVFGSVGSNAYEAMLGNQHNYVSGDVVGWVSSATDPSGGSFDTGMARNAAGVMEVNNGTKGTLATLNLAAIQINGVAALTPLGCSNTAPSSAISGTAAKTYFSLNCAIAANTLTAGKTIGIDAQGVYNGNATDTLVLTVEFCKVSGCGSGVVVQAGTSAAATLLAVSNDYWGVQANTNIFTAGASGTADTQGQAGFQTASTTIVPGVIANTGTTAIDTTVIQYLTLSAKFSTNSGSDSITLRNFKVIIQ